MILLNRRKYTVFWKKKNIQICYSYAENTDVHFFCDMVHIITLAYFVIKELLLMQHEEKEAKVGMSTPNRSTIRSAVFAQCCVRRRDRQTDTPHYPIIGRNRSVIAETISFLSHYPGSQTPLP